MITALVALLFVTGILLGILALRPRTEHAPVFAPNRAEVLARQHVLYQDLRHQRVVRPLGSTPALPAWRPPAERDDVPVGLPSVPLGHVTHQAA